MWYPIADHHDVIQRHAARTCCMERSWSCGGPMTATSTYGKTAASTEVFGCHLASTTVRSWFVGTTHGAMPIARGAARTSPPTHTTRPLGPRPVRHSRRPSATAWCGRRWPVEMLVRSRHRSSSSATTRLCFGLAQRAPAAVVLGLLEELDWEPFGGDDTADALVERMRVPGGVAAVASERGVKEHIVFCAAGQFQPMRSSACPVRRTDRPGCSAATSRHDPRRCGRAR